MQSDKMNWNDIKIFNTIGDLGSFSAAAKQLEMDHSSISRRMRQLEKEYGIKLFERDGSRIKLLHGATKLLQTAQQTTQLVNQFERELKASPDDLSGRIGFSTLYASEGRVMSVLAHFSKLHPNIELNINLSQTFENLNNNTTDVVLRATNEPTPHFIGRKITTNHFAVYGNAQHLDLSKSLDQLPWVLWRNEYTDTWVKDHFPNARCACRVNTAEGMAAAIKSGIGVGHASNLAAVKEPQLTQIHPVCEELDVDFWLLYHRDLRASRKIKLFVDFLAENLKAAWEITD
jgi:DNA-binding transcriptional LysR family regulator